MQLPKNEWSACQILKFNFLPSAVCVFMCCSAGILKRLLYSDPTYYKAVLFWVFITVDTSSCFLLVPGERLTERAHPQTSQSLDSQITHCRSAVLNRYCTENSVFLYCYARALFICLPHQMYKSHCQILHCASETSFAICNSVWHHLCEWVKGCWALK